MAPTRRPGSSPAVTIETAPAYELLHSIVVTVDQEDGDGPVGDVRGCVGVCRVECCREAHASSFVGGVGSQGVREASSWAVSTGFGM